MRTLPAELVEHYQGDNPNLVFLVELAWPSGTVRVHSGIGDLVVNDRLYKGVGSLGGLGDVQDNVELGRSELAVELSGFDSDLLHESLRRDAVGRPGIVYAAVRDGDGQPIAASVAPLFAGYIGDVGSTLGERNTITVVLATDTANPRQKRPGRYTDESHRREFAGDGFYKWSAKTAERAIYWGSRRNAVPYK